MSTTSGTLYLGGTWEQGGEQLISFSARIASATAIWCARPMWIFLDSCFLLFLFLYKCPLYTCLGLYWLCLVPLDGIKTCGFVFSCRAAEQASLLLNSAAYALAAHIWVSISTLSQLSKHGPLPLKEVCWVRNDFNSLIWVNIVDVSSHAASKSHNCVHHLRVELPLSASVTFE